MAEWQNGKTNIAEDNTSRNFEWQEPVLKTAAVVELIDGGKQLRVAMNILQINP